MYKFVAFLFALIFITGCAIQPSNILNDQHDLTDDRAIGYTLLTTLHNNKPFEIHITLAEESIPNANNSLILNVYYEGFYPRRVNEESQLKFLIVLDNGTKTQIVLKGPILSAHDLEEIEKDRKAIKAQWGKAFRDLYQAPRSFIISKDDYKKLSQSVSIKYQFKSYGVNVAGEFPPDVILSLKKYSNKFLSSKPYRGQTIDEMKKEFQEMFRDFKVLKAGARKSDIEKYFGKKFINNSKNPDTNAYEEVINIKIANMDIGPLIAGFNDKDELVYCRHYYDKNKINWYKK